MSVLPHLRCRSKKAVADLKPTFLFFFSRILAQCLDLIHDG